MDWELFEWFFWYNKVWPLHFTHIYLLGFLQGLSQVNSSLLSNLGSMVPVGRCPKAWTVPHQVGSRVTRLETKHLCCSGTFSLWANRNIWITCEWLYCGEGVKSISPVQWGWDQWWTKEGFLFFLQKSLLEPAHPWSWLCYQRFLHRWVTQSIEENAAEFDMIGKPDHSQARKSLKPLFIPMRQLPVLGALPAPVMLLFVLFW